MSKSFGNVCVLCVAAITLSAGFAHGQTLANAEKAISREGEGARRAALDKRERKPFDTGTWAKLSDWQNGKALTATDTQGKVVLIATWTDYVATGKRASTVATKAAEKYGKDGLVVVLAHSQEDWAGAVKPSAPAGSTLLVAHDAKGEFRSALDVDQDPDFYLIDRAGQLRFADIRAEAVESALAMLVKETEAEAGSINQRLDEEAGVADKAARKTAAINNSANLVQIPELPFPKPSEDDYARAKWPLRPLDEAKLQNDPKAQLPAKPVTLPASGWYPKKPELAGRAVVIYTWHPKVNFTFYESMPFMDTLQKQYGRDVVIISGMVRAEALAGVPLTDEEKSVAWLTKRFDEVCKSRDFQQTLLPFLDSNPYKEIMDNAEEKNLIGAVMILSSDGVCRWWTHEKSQVNPLAAIQQIIDNDPGIIARRKVEEEWLKAQKQK